MCVAVCVSSVRDLPAVFENQLGILEVLVVVVVTVRRSGSSCQSSISRSSLLNQTSEDNKTEPSLLSRRYFNLKYNVKLHQLR